ncbi:hypothetical protein HNQ51_002169 [Inhella inkyongensis]|uniref:Uncharacterized protein n=1 Tax=Inhella inkyongensis TaxID=392593 RepID=A0A840S3E6_9BURK|nr:hypothetical protein [Inhella inkyongensis]MBB5204855.1 hypothetical protein [Inhella inkyongensis]
MRTLPTLCRQLLLVLLCALLSLRGAAAGVPAEAFGPSRAAAACHEMAGTDPAWTNQSELEAVHHCMAHGPCCLPLMLSVSVLPDRACTASEQVLLHPLLAAPQASPEPLDRPPS